VREDKFNAEQLHWSFERIMSPSSSPRNAVHALTRDVAAEVLRCSGSLTLQATGLSMLPTIWPGDILTVTPATAAHVECGDIVLFSNSCRFVAHRITEKTGDIENVRMVTQGDAMSAADAPIHENQLLGRISLIVRDGRGIDPRKNLGRSERALARLLSRSQTAARVVVGIHGLSRRSSFGQSNVHTI
jgi:signal peptidase I